MADGWQLTLGEREATVNGGVNPPLRGGDNRGQCVRKQGRGNVRKMGVFRGLWAGKGGSKGRILASESRNKGAFLRTGGVIGGRRGVFWPESDIMS